MTRERFFDALFTGSALAPVVLALPAIVGTGAGLSAGQLLWLMTAQTVVLGAAVVFATRASRRFDAGNPVRRCWALLASGLALLTLGEATETAYAALWGIADPFPSLADVFFLLAYPLLILAFVLFLRAYQESGLPVEGGRTFAWVVAAAVIVLGLATLGPAAGSSAPLLERTIGIGYAALDLIALLPILLLLRMTWGFRGGSVWKVWAGVLFGFVFTLLADLLYAHLQAGTASGVHLLPPAQLDSLVDVLFLLSYLAIARGTLHQMELLRD